MTALLLAGLLLLPTSAWSAVDESEAGRAWQQVEPYIAPDLEAYFPDDVEGGRALDEHWDANTLRNLGDDEFLAVIRQGLRRTTKHRTSILREVGNRMIWGADPQHADAIEMCYHAADFSEAAAAYGTRHFAVYFGLSVVNENTPAILHTLVDLCVAIDDPNDIGRVAWGAASQKDELLRWLEPHLSADDPYDRAKAEAVKRIFEGEVGAFEWAAERAKQPPRPKPRVELPDVRTALREGDSAARIAVLNRIRDEKLATAMDDSYLDDLAAAAKDPEPEVRARLASFVGGLWIWNAGLHRISDPAVDLVLRLSRDPHGEVRYQAIYYGLSTYRGERDDVLERLVELAFDPSESRNHDRVGWALERCGERLATRLEVDLASEDTARARAAYELHLRVFDQRPAIIPEGIAGPSDLVGTWRLTSIVNVRDGLRMPTIEVVQDDVGRLGFASPLDEAFGTDALAGLSYTEVGEVLHFSFHTLIESAVIRSAGRLEGDRIEGTSRVDGTDTLVVWVAERAED